MAAFIIGLAQVLVFLAVAASGILSLYAAIDALATWTNIDVFISGLIAIGIAVAVMPLFCFIAAYGMVRYLDKPLWEVVLIETPIFLAWGVVTIRFLARRVSR